jgi:hypothetical protein
MTLLGLVLAAAPAAQARFIMFDADFDNRPVGSSLQRRGADFDEPIVAPGDSGHEVIVADGPGDRSVLIFDTRTSSPDGLTFGLLDDHELRQGLAHVSLYLQPEIQEEYEVVVCGPTRPADPHFTLRLTDHGLILRRDGDSQQPSIAGTYAAGDVLHVDLTFDLDAGTYTFLLSGAVVVEDEPYGIADTGIARLIVGNGADTDVIGQLRLDRPSIEYRPGAAVTWLDADFNNEPLGEPIGTGGAEFGQPIYYSSCVPVVVDGILNTPCLAVADVDTYYAGRVKFELLDNVELRGDAVSIAFTMAVDQVDDFTVHVREQGSALEAFASLYFTHDGEISFSADVDGSATELVGTYQAQTPLRIDFAFMRSEPSLSLWLDNARVLHRRHHGVIDRGVGTVTVATGNDPDLLGVLYVDNLQVHSLAEHFTPVSDGVPERAAVALRAAPNPFNPSTELRFTLPRTGRVGLEIVDVRGRRVRTLLDEVRPAGDHAVRWQGRDGAGRPVASGVYQALLRVDGERRQRLPLTLVK